MNFSGDINVCFYPLSKRKHYNVMFPERKCITKDNEDSIKNAFDNLGISKVRYFNCDIDFTSKIMLNPKVEMCNMSDVIKKFHKLKAKSTYLVTVDCTLMDNDSTKEFAQYVKNVLTDSGISKTILITTSQGYTNFKLSEGK